MPDIDRLAGRGVDFRQSIVKPAGSVFWCGQDLGSIKGHYRVLADSKHPFDRTSFGTPRLGDRGTPWAVSRRIFGGSLALPTTDQHFNR